MKKKAVIEIDMPESCVKCIFNNEELYCNLMSALKIKHGDLIDFRNIRHPNCPLKEKQEKMSTVTMIQNGNNCRMINNTGNMTINR